MLLSDITNNLLLIKHSYWRSLQLFLNYDDYASILKENTPSLNKEYFEEKILI